MSCATSWKFIALPACYCDMYLEPFFTSSDDGYGRGALFRVTILSGSESLAPFSTLFFLQFHLSIFRFRVTYRIVTVR